jgi:hypothetical protein|tara:strand:+ start:303 stop:524 length:222 start_codon:yes stop_codon:yes gene_type:complete
MDWIINKEWKKDKVILRKERNHYAKDERRLKYCESCERVWENTYAGSQVSYGHLPTYGLPRITCKICNKNNKE